MSVTDDKKIWDFLKGKGLNDYAIAGVMGNLYAESGLVPTNLQNTYEKKFDMTDAQYTAAVDNGSYTNFVKDAAGYGLTQWTYWSRKQALLEYARSKRASIGDLTMQLEYLWQELQGYKAVMSVLKSAKSIREASDIILTQYERPANQSDAVKVKRTSYGQGYYDKYAKKEVSGKMKSKAFVDKLIDIANNYKTLYVMGCFGAPMNVANKKRYCTNHSYNKTADRQKLINAATADTFGFDCVCLIKGILWGWNGDTSKTYGGASYTVNGVPDISADQMITKCAGVTTDFSKIEVGEALWMQGHIGVYIGNGLAVECTPRWKNKVQITAVLNIGAKSGYDGRKWTKHGKLPYIEYEAGTSAPVVPTPSKPGPVPTKPNTLMPVGTVVEFTGTQHFSSANATAGKAAKKGLAKITQLYPTGKHPYHIIAEFGKGSNVYGWVNAVDIKQPGKSTEEVAREVIAGKWGNGNDRKNKLKEAGYDAAAVQSKVNELLR